MTCNRTWRSLAIALALMASPAVAHAQLPPNTPVEVTVNGVFFLCPRLVRDAGAFPEADLAMLGFSIAKEPGSDAPRFKGVGDKGLLFANYEAETKSCLLHYSGGGYEAIASVVRDMVGKNGFTRITGGDEDGAKADVFQGRSPNGGSPVKIIVIENYTRHMSSISYAEK